MLRTAAAARVQAGGAAVGGGRPAAGLAGPPATGHMGGHPPPAGGPGGPGRLRVRHAPGGRAGHAAPAVRAAARLAAGAAPGDPIPRSHSQPTDAAIPIESNFLCVTAPWFHAGVLYNLRYLNNRLKIQYSKNNRDHDTTFTCPLTRPRLLRKVLMSLLQASPADIAAFHTELIALNSEKDQRGLIKKFLVASGADANLYRTFRSSPAPRPLDCHTHSGACGLSWCEHVAIFL